MGTRLQGQGDHHGDGEPLVRVPGAQLALLDITEKTHGRQRERDQSGPVGGTVFIALSPSPEFLGPLQDQGREGMLPSNSSTPGTEGQGQKGQT